MEGEGRRITTKAILGKSMKAYLKTKLKKSKRTEGKD
jgi:hypothetical protein